MIIMDALTSAYNAAKKTKNKKTKEINPPIYIY